MSNITTTASAARRLRPRTLAVIAGGAAVAIGAGGFLSTTALFTSQDRVKSNTFTTATLTVKKKVTEAFDVKDVLPGTGSVKTITFENAGTVDFDYNLSIAALTSTIPGAIAAGNDAVAAYNADTSLYDDADQARNASEGAVKAKVLGWFTVTITKDDGTEVTGDLGDLGDLNDDFEDAGSVAAPVEGVKQTGTTTVTVALNSNADNLAQGAEVEFDFVIDAKQQQ